MMRQVPRYVALLLALTACHAGPPGGVPPERQREADEGARRAIAAEQSVDVATLPPSSLGVVPFDVSATDTALAPLAYGLADLLITDLARSGRLQLVDRVRLDALLRELDLTEAGRVDTATAPRVGKLVGARRLVLGTLTTRPGGQLSVDARLADVATGGIRTAVSASASVNDILRAEKELAFRLFDQLQVNLTPAERAAVEQTPTRSIGALLAYSRGVRYEVEGQYQDAAREYQHALQLDPGFSAAAGRSQEVAPAAGPGAVAQGGAAGSGAQVDRAAGTAVDQINEPLVAPPVVTPSTTIVEDPPPSTTATVVITVEAP